MLSPTLLLSAKPTASPLFGARWIKRVITLSLPLLAGSSTLFATPPFVWEHSYGMNTRDYCSGGFPTEDGGSILYGTTYRIESTLTDIDIIEIDPQGRQTTEHILHRAGNDRITRMIPLADGGFLLCGSQADSFKTGYDYRSRGSLIKLNAQFEVVWERLYGSSGSVLNDVIQMPDGRIVAVGYTGSGWILVCDNEGRAYLSEATHHDAFQQVISMEDGSVVGVSGTYYSKFDLDGNQIWWVDSQVGYNNGHFNNAVITADGYLMRASDGNNTVVSKVDNDGRLVYRRVVAGTTIDHLAALPDGGIATVGATYDQFCFNSYNSNGDLVANMDTTFQRRVEWFYTYSTLSDFYLQGNQFVASGTAQFSGADMFCVVLNADGVFQRYHRYGMTGGTRLTGYGIVHLPDGRYGAACKSDLNYYAEGWPEILIFNEQGDSLGTIDLPIRDHSYENFSLVPSFPNPNMDQPGWFFSGVYWDSVTYHNTISLLNRNFEALWSATLPFGRDSGGAEEILPERNGDVLVLAGTPRNTVLKRFDYRGEPRDSLVAQAGSFYSVGQPTDDSYALLSSGCEVLILDSTLHIAGRFNAGVANRQNFPMQMISPAENELLVLFNSPPQQGGSNVCLTKTNTGGQIEWQRRLDNFEGYYGVNDWICTPEGRMFFCNFDGIHVFDSEARFEGNAPLPWSQGWYPSLDIAMLGFGLAPGGGLYCTGLLTDSIAIGEITLDSLGIHQEILRNTSDRGQERVSLPIAPDLSVWPNPFNSTATLNYRLNHTGRVELSIYETTGRLVKILDSGMRAAGDHSVTFDAGGLPGGIYLARLATPLGVSTRKAVLQR